MIEIRRQVCHSIERRTPEHCESENISFLRQAQFSPFSSCRWYTIPPPQWFTFSPPLTLVRANDPGLVLLDLILPGTDGMELMKEIREVSGVPVIFLSVNGQEEIIARAFEMGADDYVVKPFSPTELVARIKAVLRKREAPEWAEPSEPYVFGELTINYAERRVTLAGRPVQLTAIEYGLLFELSANAGRVMTYDRLLQRVWGLRGSGDSRRVRTAAKQLRRKLGDDANNPTYILNEPRVGYRMAKGEGPEQEDGFGQMR